MKSALSLTILLVTLCISSAVAQRPATAEPYDVDDAYKIYSVLLPNEESFAFAKGTLVIQEETMSKPLPAGCVTQEAANKFKDAIADFERVNGKQWILQPHFEIGKPYQLARQATIMQSFKVLGDWKGFDKRYPGSGGFIVVSAVGFNSDKTQAFVYTGSNCGLSCGRWSFHLLEKVEGKWKEVPGVTCVTFS